MFHVLTNEDGCEFLRISANEFARVIEVRPLMLSFGIERFAKLPTSIVLAESQNRKSRREAKPYKKYQIVQIVAKIRNRRASHALRLGCLQAEHKLLSEKGVQLFPPLTFECFEFKFWRQRATAALS